MSYYNDLNEKNIIKKLEDLLLNGGYYIRDVDGKIAVDTRLAWETPWHHVKNLESVDCYLNLRVIFVCLSMPLPREERFIPSACLDCFKVGVKPKTLTGLFSLLEVQKKMDVPSKCGIEIRTFVPSLYGGYFYTRGINEGLERYKEVREAVNNAKDLGPDTPVILKRGCTEMEQGAGRSDKWVLTEKQMQIESLIYSKMATDRISRKQRESVITAVHQRWIEWAFQHGDPTYKEYTDGKLLPEMPDYVSYHQWPKVGTMKELRNWPEEKKKKQTKQ